MKSEPALLNRHQTAQYGNALAGKVIVDISNPFNSAADGLAIPEGTSIAQEVAKAAPASASVVKAFNTVFGVVLPHTRSLDVLIAGDDMHAKAGVAEFIESLKLRPLDVGGLNNRQGLRFIDQLPMTEILCSSTVYE